MKGRKHFNHSKNFQRFTIGELRKMPFGRIFGLFIQDVSATFKKRMLKRAKKKNTVIDRTKILSDSSVSLEEKSPYFVNDLSKQVQVYSALGETQNLSSQIPGEVIKRKRGRPRKNI